MDATEHPVVVGETALAPIATAAMTMLERWIDKPDTAIERVETMVKVLERLRVASIKATYPSDWIIHTTKSPEGDIVKRVGYLQDSGAERAGKVWGIEVGNPAIEREPREGVWPDGSFSYHMVAEAWSKVTGEKLEYVEGSRWSGDKFFQRPSDPEWKVDPTDVRKSAYANLHGRAVRSLAGLGGVPLEILQQAGIDITKVVGVSYDRGSKGGTSAGATLGGAETAEFVVKWGNSKNKKVSELEPADLEYYLQSCDRDLADPAKAKYKKNTEQFKAALDAEKDKRARSEAQAAAGGAAPQPAEPGPGAAADEGGRERPFAAEDQGTATSGATPRGTKISEAWKILEKVAGKGSGMAKLLRALSTEWNGVERGSLSDLTNDELDGIKLLGEAELKKKFEALAK